MRKLLMALTFCCLTLPAGAATKPTDMINVVTYQGASEEMLTRKTYTKAWKDIQINGANRAKLIQMEKRLESEHGVSYRLYALRFTPRTTGEIILVSALYLSPFSMVGYDLGFGGEDGQCVQMNIDGNGGVGGPCF